MSKSILTSTKLLLALLVCSQAAWCDERADQGRAILKDHQDAVIVVRLVIKGGMSMAGMGSHQKESKNEATGVVIDPTGLTVVSLSETDPYGRLDEMMASVMSDSDSGIQFKSELSDVKLVLGDGREIPGKIVLRDKDLDLAFVRPVGKPEKPMDFIDLSADVHLEMLDELVVLDRMPSTADRVSHVSLSRVQSVVQKPRTYYVISGGSLGAPVFTPDGKVVGIDLVRKGQGGGSSLTSLMSNSGYMVLPAGDIREAALQAPSVDAVPDANIATENIQPATGG
jgi:hypothetical protein